VRVALLHTPLDTPGGGERQVLHLAHELERLRHEVVLYTNRLDAQHCYPDLIEGLNIEDVGKGRLLAPATRLFEFAQVPSADKVWLFTLGRAPKEGVEVVNAHNLGTNWGAALAKRRLKVPAVWMCNEPPHAYHTPMARLRWQGWAERLFLAAVDRTAARSMDKIVVLDRKNEERVRSAYGAPSVVVRSGVDADFFEKRAGDDRRGDWGLEGRFVLLHVGYAAPFKGQQDSLLALKELRLEDPGVALVLAGAGTKAAYTPLAEELGLKDHVRFFEGISNEALATLYASCDALLFPADQTWGLNVTEAWAAGKPVVVSKAAGVCEVVDDGVTGFKVPYGSPGAIAKAARALRADPALGRKMGASGRAFVREKLTWSAYARAMVDVYKDALAGPSN